MAQQSEYLKISIPDMTDEADAQVIFDGLTAIDAELGEHDTRLQQLKAEDADIKKYATDRLNDIESRYATLEYVDAQAVTIDQTYIPESENAQSGTAVAGAVDTVKSDVVTPASWGDKYGSLAVCAPDTTYGGAAIKDTTYYLSSENPSAGDSNTVPTVTEVKRIVADELRAVETALDEIIAIQEELIGSDGA